MICSTCGIENPAGKRFCGDCGAALAAVCPACGAANPPDKRFCGDCGTPLTAGTGGGTATGATAGAHPAMSAAALGPDPGGPVAERRLVSVLFADLVGFTSYAEGRDAEQVRETLTRYFSVARAAIEVYGGRVEKFIGDAVMALWGAPIAREDDAERAVRAALELVDAVRGLGPGIMARAGVMTGEAAVTIGATNEGMVAGDLVNTAARVQAAAAPGGVLVGEATMRAASAAIVFEAAGDETLKGKSAPVRTWRALRIVAQRGGHGRSDLPEPPFVGRAEELRLLKDLIATTGRDRRTRLVSITGPGGIGKSRLAWELEKYVDGIAEPIYWHRGRSPSYGEGITFWALGEMVRRRTGLAEEDDAETTRRRVAATVDEYVTDDEDRRWIEPALLTLLGLEPAPPGGRDVLFAAWRLFFEHVAERGTAVLLFEDLQWADTGLLDFIEYLLEWSRAVPLLVIVLARPELFERRPDWGSVTRHHIRMALEPLTKAAMRELLDGFVPGLPQSAVDSILARADGIPLYAVETVRALVDDGRLERIDGGYRPVGDIGTLSVPATLRSLIASRLDALEPSDRGIVADASVLGQSFSIEGLAAIVHVDRAALEARLRVLVRRELFDLELDPRSPERGQYRFVQSLIREVAYGTLARRDRRDRHLAAARFYESLGDGELAGALATHYVAAHAASDPGPEADAVAIQARIALGGAADRAAALGAHDQAVAYLRSAIVITSDSAERGGMLLRAARSANAAARHADAEALVRQAVDVARSVGDAAALGAAQDLLGEILIDSGQPPMAVAVLEEALAELPDDAPAAVRAGLLATYSRALMRTARSRESIEAADGALDLAEHLHLDRLIAESLNNKGSSLGYLGRRIEGTALLRAAAEVARAGGIVAAEARALSNLGASDEDSRRAHDWAMEAWHLASRVGDRSHANWALETARFHDYLLAERWDEAVSDTAIFGDPSSAATRSPLDEVRTLSISAMFLVARGDPIDEILARVDALAADVTDEFAQAAGHSLRADRAFFAGDYRVAFDEAMRAASEPNIGALYMGRALHAAVWDHDLARLREVADALDAFPGTDASLNADRIAARAAIAMLEGRPDDAVAGYRDVLARLRSIGSSFLVGQAALDFVILVGPDHPAAGDAADEARLIFERIGARPYLERLDAAIHRTSAQGQSAASHRPSVTGGEPSVARTQ